MRNIRIGKDFDIKWRVFRKEGDTRSPYEFQDDVKLKLVSSYGSREVTGWTIDGNMLSWTFRGKDQKYIGPYQLVLIENDGNDGMVTVDICDAFNLVAHSCQETGAADNGDVVVETVELYSDVIFAPLRTIDDFLSNESVNPVENRVITEALKQKQGIIYDLETIRAGAAKGATALQQHQDISHLATKKEVTEGLSGKVDNINGKGLSTEDFTSAEKTKLAGLQNYDDSTIVAEIGKKQDKIADLQTIRDGAKKGATALQQHQDISHLATKIEVKAVDDKVTKLETNIESISPTPMVSVTYAELKTLRDNGELIPGMQYRITDYMTTTTQENTRSARHQFDVIVTADSINTLNEKARACKIDFDIENYKDAYCPSSFVSMIYLGTYEYKGKSYHRYEAEDRSFEILIDFLEVNDRANNRPLRCGCYPQYIKWSGEEDWSDGDGEEDVDFGHDPYISYFSGVKVEAWQIWYCLDNDRTRFAWADTENGRGVIYRMIDEHLNDVPYDFKNIQYKEKVTKGHKNIEFYEYGVTEWVYTFSCIKYDRETGETLSDIYDGSIVSPYGYMNDEGYYNTFVCNKIGPYYSWYDEDENYQNTGICKLNNIIMLGVVDVNIGVGEGLPSALCCSHNEIGDQCNSIRISKNNYFNKIGGNCSSIRIMASCRQNTIDGDCHDIYLREGNRWHNIGRYCTYITIDEQGDNIKIGSNGFYINIGLNAYHITIGGNCRNIDLLKNQINMKYITIGDGCANLVFNAPVDGNSFAVSYYHIDGSVGGEEIDLYRNRGHSTYITLNSNGDLMDLCLGDMSVS